MLFDDICLEIRVVKDKDILHINIVYKDKETFDKFQKDEAKLFRLGAIVAQLAMWASIKENKYTINGISGSGRENYGYNSDRVYNIPFIASKIGAGSLFFSSA